MAGALEALSPEAFSTRTPGPRRLFKLGLLLWQFKPSFKVSSSTAEWHRSSYGTDFDNSESGSLVKQEASIVRACTMPYAEAESNIVAHGAQCHDIETPLG